MQKKILVLIFISTFILVLLGPAPTPVQAGDLWVPPVDLGTLGGSKSAAFAINNLDQIVGHSMTAAGITHAFLWQNGQMSELAGINASYDSSANDINDAGQIVGYAQDILGNEVINHPILWENGALIDLGTLGGLAGEAYALNDLGQVVGSAAIQVGSYDYHAFLWQKEGGMVDLGTLGGAWSVAKAINNHGQIVGESVTSAGESHAFLWQDGVMTDLGTFSNYQSSANGINDQGQIVIGATDVEGISHAFLVENGTVTPLDTIEGIGWVNGYGTGINRAGYVIATNSIANSRTKVIELLPDFQSIDYAFGINDSCHIVGVSVVALSTDPFPETAEHAAYLPQDCWTYSDRLQVSPTLSFSQSPALVNSLVQVSGTFAETNPNLTHTAVWDWGDGTISNGAVSEANGFGTVTGSHVYQISGQIVIMLFVKNQYGLTINNATYLMVVDPHMGFVTGSGWYDSPPFAYFPDPGLTGKAKFNLDVRYKEGEIHPVGKIDFDFKAANLKFESSSFEWMVMIDSSLAWIEGTGTVNGQHGYHFIVFAGDGKISGGKDKFQIHIFEPDTGNTYYSFSANEYPYPIEGGSVVVHKGK